jgi:ATP-dependent DNA helicase RecQ
VTTRTISEFATDLQDSRLTRALSVVEDGGVGGPDLVALVRSSLVRSEYASATVPSHTPWPRPEDWQRGSCTVESNDGYLTVTPRPWLPAWGHSAALPADVDPARGVMRQHPQAERGDPFLRDATGGWPDYRTPGQREAVRTVLGARPGSTVLVVLPTGSGKTVAVSAPAFLARPGVSVLVVPTVSLALDLERRFASDYGLSDPIAYHGGLSVEEKSHFRDRLREGRQWIVVTSPEAACASLATTLQHVAGAGRLRYFAIDEAHMVASWGGAFRPAFQALGGLRRRLQSAARAATSDFTTVLLTGTLDDHGLDTLEHFFVDGELNLVVAQATRPEPTYWTVECADDDRKQHAVVEAVRHLPRPLLLYTSLVDSDLAVNAKQARSWLRDAGFTRVDLITGQSSAAERQRSVAAIRAEGEPVDDIDVVVASSAFGLGVDIDDVRSVVHACIPESVDRFYQEVGRSGRDGRASSSVLIHSPADRRVARQLAASGDIGTEKSFLRWQEMIRGSTESGDYKTVNLTAAHPGVVAPSSEANRRWNLHTLASMERCGMIRLHWMRPPDVSRDASDEEVAELFELHNAKIDVEVLHGDLSDEGSFKRRFREKRSAAGGSADASRATVLGLLDDPTECNNAVFARAYQLQRPNGDTCHVQTQCGGCPSCRATGRPLRLGRVAPEPYAYTPEMRPVTPALEQLVGDIGPCSITYEQSSEIPWGEIEPLVGRLIDGGVRCLVVPVRPSPLDDLHEHSRERWLAVDDLRLWMSRWTPVRMATALVLPPDATSETVGKVLDRTRRGISVIIHQSAAPGPVGSKLLLQETVRHRYDLADALRRI